MTLRLTFVLALSASLAGAQAPPAPRIAASSLASVEVHINARHIGARWYDEDAGLAGPSRIAITYGQPHARGRIVEGGLIPLDTIWRLGANAATSLHTDVDLTLGDLHVPRGDYSLFLRYSRSATQLVVNRGSGQWGTDYDRSKDLGRVTVASRPLAGPVESLTIYLVPEAAQPTSGLAELRGTLKIQWGTTEFSTGWHVEQ